MIQLLVLIVSSFSPLAPDLPEFREIDGIEIQGGEGDTLQLLATVTLENLLSLEPVLVGLTYEILLEDSLSGSGQWTGRQLIPDQDLFQLQLSLSIPERMIPHWISFLSGRDSVSLAFGGQMDVEVMGIPWSQSWSVSQRMLLDGLLDQLLVREALRLQPRITDISMPNPSLFSSSMELGLSFTNTYPFPITLAGIDVGIELNRSEIGRMTSTSSCRLPADSSLEQTYSIRVEHLAPILSMIRSVSNQGIDYVVDGTVEVIVDEVCITLPIKVQGSLSFDIF